MLLFLVLLCFVLNTTDIVPMHTLVGTLTTSPRALPSSPAFHLPRVPSACWTFPASGLCPWSPLSQSHLSWVSHVPTSQTLPMGPNPNTTSACPSPHACSLASSHHPLCSLNPVPDSDKTFLLSYFIFDYMCALCLSQHKLL